MMKFIVALILSALLSYAACLFLPWWSIALAAFIVAFFVAQKPGRAFISAFMGLFILWGLMSYFISSHNGHILANKISMLILKSNRPMGLIILTAFIGGLVAAVAALSGSLLRKILIK